MVRRSSAARRRPTFRRATYYLRPDQIRNLKLCAAWLEQRLSAVMREAVDQYLKACAPPEILAGNGQSAAKDAPPLSPPSPHGPSRPSRPT